MCVRMYPVSVVSHVTSVSSVYTARCEDVCLYPSVLSVYRFNTVYLCSQLCSECGRDEWTSVHRLWRSHNSQNCLIKKFV